MAGETGVMFFIVTDADWHSRGCSLGSIVTGGAFSGEAYTACMVNLLMIWKIEAVAGSTYRTTANTVLGNTYHAAVTVMASCTTIMGLWVDAIGEGR